MNNQPPNQWYHSPPQRRQGEQLVGFLLGRDAISISAIPDLKLAGKPNLTVQNKSFENVLHGINSFHRLKHY